MAHASRHAANQVVRETFTLSKRQAVVSQRRGDLPGRRAAGRIGSLEPGDRGYAAAALARRNALFARNDRPGTVAQITLPGGSYFGTYLIQNSTAERFLAHNGKDRLASSPLAFFSFTAANPDQFQHVQKPSGTSFTWEDLTFGGDRDFNDAVVTFSSAQPPPPVSFQLDPSTDSAPVGDDQTTFASVILVGHTEPNVPVALLETGATTISDSSGRFEFDGVNLRSGQTHSMCKRCLEIEQVLPDRPSRVSR